MSKFYKTVRGEVYGKCGITFGAEPVEVSDAKLKEVGGTLKMSVADRLAADRRLVEVDPPEAKPSKPSKPSKASKTESADADKTGNSNDKSKGNQGATDKK